MSAALSASLPVLALSATHSLSFPTPSDISPISPKGLFLNNPSPLDVMR